MGVREMLSKHNKIILFLLGVISIMFLLHKDQKKRASVITVYVHGTLFNWRNILATIPVASQLTYVPDGLTLVKNLDKEAIAHSLARDFCKKDSKRFVYDNFYAFGWSGKWSFEERDKSSKFLSEELVKISSEYEQENGIKPVIRIVTFSHGGNVALGMASYLPKNFEVEVICIGCPIQPETENWMVSDCFSKIYVISSLNDIIQVSDPINIYRNMRRDNAQQLLSKRFSDYDGTKLKQACVSVNGTYLGHYELFQLFNKHVPAVLNRLDALSEIHGTKKFYVDVTDKFFRFYNGFNVVQVLRGQDKNPNTEDSEDEHSPSNSI